MSDQRVVVMHDPERVRTNHHSRQRQVPHLAMSTIPLEESDEEVVPEFVVKPTRERGRRSSLVLTQELNKINEVALQIHKDSAMGGDAEIVVPVVGAEMVVPKVRKPRERGRRSSLVLAQALEAEMGGALEDECMMMGMDEMPMMLAEE